MPDYFHLPRYEAAVKRENGIRNAAFLNLPANICGCNVMQMTLWHWIILDGVDAPFVNGFDLANPPKPESIVMFLWVLSREFRRFNRLGIRSGWIWEHAKRRFAKRLRTEDYAALIAACIDYVHDTFQDAPPSGESDRFNRAPHWSYATSVINSIASRYGWDDEKVIQKPLKVLFQYQKIIDAMRQAESGNRPILFNPSDAIKRSEIAEQRAEREKMKLHPGQQVSD